MFLFSSHSNPSKLQGDNVVTHGRRTTTKQYNISPFLGLSFIKPKTLQCHFKLAWFCLIYCPCWITLIVCIITNKCCRFISSLPNTSMSNSIPFKSLGYPILIFSNYMISKHVYKPCVIVCQSYTLLFQAHRFLTNAYPRSFQVSFLVYPCPPCVWHAQINLYIHTNYSASFLVAPYIKIHSSIIASL